MNELLLFLYEHWKDIGLLLGTTITFFLTYKNRKTERKRAEIALEKEKIESKVNNIAVLEAAIDKHGEIAQKLIELKQEHLKLSYENSRLLMIIKQKDDEISDLSSMLDYTLSENKTLKRDGQ